MFQRHDVINSIYRTIRGVAKLPERTRIRLTDTLDKLVSREQLIEVVIALECSFSMRYEITAREMTNWTTVNDILESCLQRIPLTKTIGEKHVN